MVKIISFSPSDRLLPNLERLVMKQRMPSWGRASPSLHLIGWSQSSKRMAMKWRMPSPYLLRDSPWIPALSPQWAEFHHGAGLRGRSPTHLFLASRFVWPVLLGCLGLEDYIPTLLLIFYLWWMIVWRLRVKVSIKLKFVFLQVFPL